MKKIVWAGLMIVISAMFMASAAMAESLNKEALQNLYMEYLKGEGYRPEVDEDGDVMFRREGKIYFLFVTEDDSDFFRLVLPNIWPIESIEENLQVLAAADFSNALSKVSKVYTVNDDVWVSIEMFLPSQKDFSQIFRRSMEALDNGVANFVRKMQG
ncbi:hypothetical protein OOT00_01485 [Desulfobotulus sp. H1]|uniref:YbjN domain-containing protein n=1 Tax=Desulfobotulus pelophilus TaxID=2823377 RepID=A0ABT3N5D3_9BACT|nr:hypothetical protein [Desulfobotulus pelophilus]MCW7752654.1 hypothetical protein [Desulfobotulus pelophilus]